MIHVCMPFMLLKCYQNVLILRDNQQILCWWLHMADLVRVFLFRFPRLGLIETKMPET